MLTVYHYVGFAVVNLVIIATFAAGLYRVWQESKRKDNPEWATSLIKAVQKETADLHAQSITWEDRIDALESKYRTMNGRVSALQRASNEPDETDPQTAMMRLLATMQRPVAPPPPTPYIPPQREESTPIDPWNPNGLSSGPEKGS